MSNAPEPPARRKPLSTTCAALGLSALLFASPQAEALSELRGSPNEQNSGPDDGRQAPSGIPLPDPLINRPPTDEADSPDEDTGDGAADAEIIMDLSQLPEPVRRMRELIVEAAASGDYERLRPLTDPGPRQTQVNGEISDPLDAMRSFSGDPEGLEILAILLDILATGAARMDAGTPQEAYVWPYFAGKDLKSLSPPERVELLRIVTAGDLMAMEEAGNYNFYRLAITPDGEWRSFVGGD
ncbi:hypothetical protein ABID21_002152 [Pseudorhizobium tarimense]|uniref:Uncharacterized protein n=1 Tax=Pseudorhizobium tarimense TaxID=1079109 RepID=A0ABV2H6G7_9HYPH|nr:hypothetical protein [Pseudorhizobium tarimense]MCJ8519126.1 hypothetical protein [Pseudorhizobium tarimense]